MNTLDKLNNYLNEKTESEIEFSKLLDEYAKAIRVSVSESPSSTQSKRIGSIKAKILGKIRKLRQERQ